MIPAVPASLQCVVADSGKLQSPDTHGDAARVTRANSFMYRQKPRLYTHQNWGFSCLAAITAPGGDDGRITGHWPNVTNIKHQHVTLSQPHVIADCWIILLSVYWFQSVEKLLSVYYRRVTGPASKSGRVQFSPHCPGGQSAVSGVSPGMARAHVFNEYKALVRMRGGGRVWAVSIRVCSELTAKFTHQL